MGALALVASLALVLAWPVLQAGGSYVLRTRDSSAEVTPAQAISLPGLLLNQEAKVATGFVNDNRWHLTFGAGAALWCFSFVIAPGPSEGVSCVEGPVPIVGASVQFTPAELSNGDHGVVVAALPHHVEKLRLRATNDRSIRGVLVRPPAEFTSRPALLVAFLPPETDIIEAEAWNAENDPVAVRALVDMIADY